MSSILEMDSSIQEVWTYPFFQTVLLPALVAQSDMRSTDDQEGVGSIPGNILSIYHEMFSVFLLSPTADSRRAFGSFWRKNVHRYWLTA